MPKLDAPCNGKILVLDAMGVLYQACDDVEELLIPFILSLGNGVEPNIVKRLYTEASLGHITSHEFWASLNIPLTHEDDYLSGYKTSEGLFAFLDAARSFVDDIICLSNDLSEWSIKLRNRFALGRYISEWFISGDLGVRKPDERIYSLVSNFARFEDASFFFFDDNPRNVTAAERSGWCGYVFTQNSKKTLYGQNLTLVEDFNEALSILTRQVSKK